MTSVMARLPELKVEELTEQLLATGWCLNNGTAARVIADTIITKKLYVENDMALYRYIVRDSDFDQALDLIMESFDEIF